ncbi:sulfite exporter TauE/SafE family protein [Adhaeribacter radiodurans]|uniref:Sulfite exporter TauE/SafE family protein n=1 Tax=Adhaeribacter radiodurans TaxID=2745197 RepID=A0A7L7L1K0_9BACT|nr:sulfite exporter TauE/SafE family protein [Adhaeribacter radiodurans]QMU26661.1 sulfite exporter TauE/SafE family protein [Adhaeribacter radiodurans]
MIWAGFLFGILGSFHCVGMCGPIALALPVGRGAGLSFVTGRLLYNLGRIVTYTALGALAGAVGKSLQIALFQQTLSIVSGVLILLVLVIPVALIGKFRSFTGFGKLLTLLKKTIARYFGKNSTWALGVVGLLNGLLPCGFVYFALAGAMSMSSIPAAMLYMFLFGLGTFPLMFILSLSGKLIQPRIRHFFNRSVPYVAGVLALLFILRGLNLGIPYVSPVMAQSKTGGTQIHACGHPKIANAE